MRDREKVYASICEDLASHNICKHCCLRYINEKNPDSYNDIDKYLRKLRGDNGNGEKADECGTAAKQRKCNPCSACLGLLQLCDDDDFLDIITKEVTAAGYDSDDVTFALSLPITLLLRDYSISLYTSDKYGEHLFDPFNSHKSKAAMNAVSIKEAWKWVSAPKLAEKLNKSVNSGVDGNFHVNIHFEYEMDSSETSCLLDMFPEIFKCRSTQKRKFHGEILTRKSVENALPDVDLSFFKKYYPVPPTVPEYFVKCSSVECVQDSIYIAGRYNKFSRSLSQTPWVINGERRMESSVEEIIGGPVSNMIKHSGIKFSSSGREDVDVRTLGEGRPFVLEVTNPRRVKLDADTLRQLETDINSSTEDVFVRDLQVVQKEDLVNIKMGEQNKTKTYNCYCITKLGEGEDVKEFEKKLSQLTEVKDLVVQQRTPIRVLHRRSLAVRPRTVLWLHGCLHEVKGDNVFFKVTLEVDAGTYIKEFVHGDFGRTKPNLSEILEKEADILALDVEKVALHWPPRLEYGQDCSGTQDIAK